MGRAQRAGWARRDHRQRGRVRRPASHGNLRDRCRHRPAASLPQPRRTARSGWPACQPGSYALEYRDCAARRPLPDHLVRRSSRAERSRARAGRRRPGTACSRHDAPARSISRPPSPPAQASFRRALAANGRDLDHGGSIQDRRDYRQGHRQGQAVRGICVTVLPAGAVDKASARSTAKNGTYSIRAVKPGRYHVIFRQPVLPSRTNWLPQVYSNDNSPFALFNGGGHRSQGPRRSQDCRYQREPAAGRRDLRHCHQQVRRANWAASASSAFGSVGHKQFFGFAGQTAANGSYHLARAVPRQVPAAVQPRLRLARQQLRPCHTLRREGRPRPASDGERDTRTRREHHRHGHAG